MSDALDLPARRDQLVDAHEVLGEQHEELRGKESALLEHREHRDALIEHRDAIADYDRELALLSDAQRQRLQVTRIGEETERMLAETRSAIENARAAWKRATDAWQRVREKLDEKH